MIGEMIHSNADVDMVKIREEFPILSQTMRGKPLVYLDTAATSQKPQAVLDALSNFCVTANANVHRGVYELSERATAMYEASRQSLRHFINAQHNEEIVFTRGTTEAINLVASSFSEIALQPGDEILISTMEHHSNIVPWQMACKKYGAVLKVIPLLSNGTIDFEAFEELLSPKTKLLAVVHVSNVLGTINPVKAMIQLAHAQGIPVLIDGAQAVSHLPVDVQDLDCDFYAFSSHKMYGPTGVGVLYAKRDWLEKMPPYQTGGDMIARVTFAHTDFNVLPHKFEAGTPDMAGVIGLGEAVQYIQHIGYEAIQAHEAALLAYTLEQLRAVPGLQIIGDNTDRSAVVSFVMASAHPHDIATILDQEGIAVRAGHHCAMPLMAFFHLPATARVSLGIYNNTADIDRLSEALHQVNHLFGAA